ncbi:hypothetical protein HN670_01015 [bacterium]|jgi:hypothetical protein|nr:hypothetical protein [bacterium]
MDLKFTKDELLIINNSLNETSNALGDDECLTKIGVTRDEVKILLKKVGEELDK